MHHVESGSDIIARNRRLWCN